jgi:tetratricopeptide (TPR) repeat protein
LSQDHIVRVKIEDSGTISVFSGSTQSLESRNATFMWFQLFIEALLRMHHKSNTKQELIDVCKEYYKNNHDELAIIDEFAKTYKKENAIWWYTRECCLYRMLNKALRIQDFDLLFVLRFFITDLSEQLTDEYERYLREIPTRDIIRVYRGQIISVEELKLIQSNIGQFISMNSFLSTSLLRRTALSFINTIEINNEFDRILFEIDIDPHEKTKAYSNIDRLSYFKCEDELLIMLGALFRIQSINQDKKRNLWIANLTLANEDDFYLKETFAHLKEKIGDETNLHSIGKILTEMGEYQQAQKCYQRMIYESQLDQSIGYAGLGWADHWLNHYDQALQNFQKSLHLTNQIIPDISEEKGRLYSLIGLVYWRKKLYNEALTNLKTALDIQQAILPPEHPDILATYNRFAITYSAINDVDMALKYYNKCLNIRLDTLPHDHFDIATSYNNIGWLYNERIGDYNKALEYFQKALTICRKILPPTHRDIIRTELNIKKVNEKLKDKSN